MIRLFASDLDGTLLNEKHQFDDVIVEGIQKIVNSGHVFSIATGRGKSQCSDPRIDSLVYKVCMNGALILDPKNRAVAKEKIDRSILAQILDEFEEYPFDFVNEDHILTRYPKKEFLERRVFATSDEEWKERYMRDFLPRIQFGKSKEEILNASICKINLRINDVDDYSRLDAFLKAHADWLVNAPSGKGLYEITAAGVNKGSALMKLASFLNIEPNEVAVYGDGGNDVAMLSLFDNAYVPENGMPQAKKEAKEILADSKDHSVIDHMLQTIKEQK
ncbi:HAD family hydrolase [Dubosiella newyorkensis]|uniref:HAD family hydrolase n=1 Tax=Dubosiella newyorkensis TaxID=1862672 RepID=UPI00272EC717|nr:HAD family hydrolase [Dubosiella newyorkensis]